MNIMKKSTCKYLTFTIYRHVACRAVTMVMTMTGRDGTGLTGWAARAQLSQASYMQWSFVAGGNSGGLPIDSSVGHH